MSETFRGRFDSINTPEHPSPGQTQSLPPENNAGTFELTQLELGESKPPSRRFTRQTVAPMQPIFDDKILKPMRKHRATGAQTTRERYPEPLPPQRDMSLGAKLRAKQYVTLRRHNVGTHKSGAGVRLPHYIRSHAALEFMYKHEPTELPDPNQISRYVVPER